MAANCLHNFSDTESPDALKRRDLGSKTMSTSLSVLRPLQATRSVAKPGLAKSASDPGFKRRPYGPLAWVPNLEYLKTHYKDVLNHLQDGVPCFRHFKEGIGAHTRGP